MEGGHWPHGEEAGAPCPTRPDEAGIKQSAWKRAASQPSTRSPHVTPRATPPARGTAGRTQMRTRASLAAPPPSAHASRPPVPEGPAAGFQGDASGSGGRGVGAAAGAAEQVTAGPPPPPEARGPDPAPAGSSRRASQAFLCRPAAQPWLLPSSALLPRGHGSRQCSRRASRLLLQSAAWRRAALRSSLPCAESDASAQRTHKPRCSAWGPASAQTSRWGHWGRGRTGEGARPSGSRQSPQSHWDPFQPVSPTCRFSPFFFLSLSFFFFHACSTWSS